MGNPDRRRRPSSAAIARAGRELSAFETAVGGQRHLRGGSDEHRACWLACPPQALRSVTARRQDAHLMPVIRQGRVSTVPREVADA